MWGRQVHKACWLLAGILLAVLPSAAQLQVGDNWQMNLGGNIGYTYNGNLNQGTSAHSMGFSGDANLHGSYFNPNFLNFSVQPYYDRTQSNSVFGALSNSSGVTSSVNLFSGSHFPGAVFFAKGVNSSGEFGIPSSSVGLAEHGDNQGFGVSWSALIPDLPTLTASYTVGNGSSSIYGSQEENSQADRTLTMLSTYFVSGFRLSGGFTHRNVDANYSQLLDGLPEPVETNTSSNSFQFNAQHALPMSGSASVGWSRSNFGYDYHDSYDTNSSGGSQTLNGLVTFRPARKLTVAMDANYNDSLLGSVPEPILNNGTAINSVSLSSFNNFQLGADAYYQLLSNLSVHGNVNHTQQDFLGKSYSATTFGGSANYNLQKRFLGSLSFSIGVFDSANQEGNSGLGFVGNLNFDRKIANWDVGANFSYSQNVQTLILVYTTSSYSWVANARRRVANRTYFSAGYGGSHSGITNQPGTSNSSERVSSSLTWRTYSVNGFYSKSDGAAFFTPTGLVAVPAGLPPELFAPGSVMVYNSKAIGGNASAVFMRRLTLSLGYADSRGSTVDPLISTFTGSKLYNAIGQYRLRKIYINGGFTQLHQSVGAAGTAPVAVTSYYIGISRWFNFF
jgi:hypothetical protein